MTAANSSSSLPLYSFAAFFLRRKYLCSLIRVFRVLRGESYPHSPPASQGFYVPPFP